MGMAAAATTETVSLQPTPNSRTGTYPHSFSCLSAHRLLPSVSSRRSIRMGCNLGTSLGILAVENQHQTFLDDHVAGAELWHFPLPLFPCFIPHYTRLLLMLEGLVNPCVSPAECGQPTNTVQIAKAREGRTSDERLGGDAMIIWISSSATAVFHPSCQWRWDGSNPS